MKPTDRPSPIAPPLGVTASAWRVLLAFLEAGHNVTLTKIAQELGCSTATVHYHAGRLVDAGWLEWRASTSSGYADRYRLSRQSIEYLRTETLIGGT